MSAPVLQVRGLRTEFRTRNGTVRATRDVDLAVEPGETLGLVGESGSGKSVFLRSLIGLLPPPGRITAGEVFFEGRDLLKADEDELRKVRGGKIALISQDPINSFNPSLSVSFQMTRVLKLHRDERPERGWNEEAQAMLGRVGIETTAALHRYPFNFSQGQLQRIMTAMAALSGKPTLLLADEPTTSLDVTIEAQILWLISRLQTELGMSVIFVTHDLGVIAQMADRVAVMYAGSVVEEAPVERLFARPAHPYTIGLLRSSKGFLEPSENRLYALRGMPPDLTDVQPGCPFAPRCEWASEICRRLTPPLRLVGGGQVACHHAESVAEAAAS